MNAITKSDDQQLQTWDDRPAPAILATTPMALLDRAVAQGADIAVLERLMSLQERWEASQARKAFDDALANAKAEIPTIAKNRHVHFEHNAGGGKTDYHHEDLAEIARTIDPILGKHGLSYRFRTTSEIGQPITVTCVVSHRGGHFETNTLIGPRDDSGKKNAIQQIGSALTYLQRYTLKAALGLAASNDDDGKGSEPSENITDDQFGTLRKLMIERGANEIAFLKFFKLDDVAALPAARFAEAVEMLNRKARKQ